MSETQSDASTGQTGTPDEPTSNERTSDAVRLSVNLAPDVAAALRRMARQDGVSITEIVRRAISTESFLEEQRSEGKKVLIADKDDKNVREVVFR